MPDVGSVKYKVELDNSGLDGEAKKTESSIASKLDAISGKLSRSFGYQVLKDIGSAFVDMGKQAVQGFAEITKASVESRAALEQNLGGVETLFGSSAETVIANAERAYQSAGMSANTYMETVTSFSASLLQSLEGDTVAAASAADQAIIDMSDNANKMGTDIQAIQNAYQGFAKGNFTMLDNLKLGFGGTRGEMERLIEEANKVKEANGEMADLSIDSFADITEAIHIIQTEMGITGTTAAEASATIEGSMNAAKAAYDNFLNGSITGEEFAETAMVAVENIANSVAESVQNFADQLPGMVDVVAEKIPELVETLGPPLLDALGAVAQSVDTIGGTLIDSLVAGTIENAPKMMESAAAAISSLLDGITARLPDVINNGVQVVMAISTGIANNLPTIIASAGKLIVTLITGLIQALPQLTAAALQIVTALANYLIDNGPQILQAGIELVGKLVAGLIQAIPKVAEGVQRIIQRIKDKFADIDWGEVGRQIIEGIKNGITGAAGSIAEAVGGLGRGLVGRAKKALKISSPSKVFRDEVGAMIPAGMAEGIEDGAPEVESSMDKLLRGFTADVDYNLPNLSDYAQDLGASVSASANMQITVPVTLDGREIARATAWYTNEQLAWEARG